MNTNTQQTAKTVNMSVIYNDINNLRKEIADKKRELAMKEAFLEGLDHLEEKGLSATLRGVWEAGATVVEEENPQHVRGVGEFIQQILRKNDRMDTKDIFKAWASSTGQHVEDVRNNVQNTLSRLKSKGIIKNKPNKGGRRGGSKWYLSKVQSN